MIKFIGKNKRICDQITEEWESRNEAGGEKMIARYMQASKLSLEEIYGEMDWEYINSLESDDSNSLCLPVE